jgi:hypothetical protein
MVREITCSQDIIYILKKNERIAFDLQSRTLVLTTGCLLTRVTRFSPIDAHLMLPLVYFYPHYVSDETLSIGYTTNLRTYYQYLKEEEETRKLPVPYPIADGIDRLKKKVAPLGITIVRVRNTGYILESYADALSIKGTHTHNMSQQGKCEDREEDARFSLREI